MPTMQLDRMQARQLDPLDPFIAEAVERRRRRTSASPAESSLMQTLMRALVQSVAEVPAWALRQYMARAMRDPADETELENRRAQLEHTKALTDATRAQTAARAEEDNPAAQLRKVAIARTAETGDLAGVEDIAAGKIQPGAAPAIVETGREALAAAAAAARQRAESGFGSNAAQAVDEYAGTIGGLMDRARRSHPGAPGERIARDLGEEAAGWMYERDVPETPLPATSVYSGKPVQERSQPGQAAAEQLRQTLVESILRMKGQAYGRGQEGVTPEEIGGHFDAKRRAWRTF